LFVEDMRRGGVECLPPDVNASQRRFHGRGRQGPLRARRAQGRRREGDGALVEERERGGPFKSPRGFRRADRSALLNRRQIESLAGGGAFDALEPDRAAVFAAAETILAHAASAADQRESGQAGLFGGGESRRRADPPAARRLDAGQRMAAERDAFGFYFSAHPVDRQRHLLAAHKVKSFAELATMPRSGRGRRRDVAAR
jgi:DNA polymerase-3 subunit alpha